MLMAKYTAIMRRLKNSLAVLKMGLDYIGAFGPLRIRDYIYAACLPEYEKLETTFSGSLLARVASRVLKKLASFCAYKSDKYQTFPRPSKFSQMVF